jgi:exodeoxyribonuclease V alpha subunit
MYSFAPQLMTRNLLYTAVTRAQQMVVLVGRKEIVAQMVVNNRRVKRYSALADLLRATDS